MAAVYLRISSKFIDCAVEAQADYLISGDAHLLRVKACRGIAIYSPKDFLQIINP